MTTIANPKLLEEHKAYIARCKADGDITLAYSTPCCGQQLECRVPPEGEGPWDSLISCPYCNGLFMQVARHDHVTGYTSEELKRGKPYSTWTHP